MDRLETKGETYLDLGCCFGQDIRRLVCDGAPSEHLYGADLRKEFMDLGYDLFLDKDRLKSEFIEADVFDDKSDLERLDGKVDILMASAFFHLFDMEAQIKAAKRIIKLLKPHAGSMLVGRHGGSTVPGEWRQLTDPSKSTYRHNVETWKQFWKDIGDETGTQWNVEVITEEAPLGSLVRPDYMKDFRWLVFAVRRVE